MYRLTKECLMQCSDGHLRQRKAFEESGNPSLKPLPGMDRRWHVGSDLLELPAIALRQWNTFLLHVANKLLVCRSIFDTQAFDNLFHRIFREIHVRGVDCL